MTTCTVTLTYSALDDSLRLANGARIPLDTPEGLRQLRKLLHLRCFGDPIAATVNKPAHPGRKLEQTAIATFLRSSSPSLCPAGPGTKLSQTEIERRTALVLEELGL